ncbi:MAG: molybdopterin-dependent oxidoreductase [Gammaproteobacteria bacterium]
MTFINSACPHDCPSTCALEIEVLSPTHIGRVRGAKDNTYTDGVICSKVARYAERTHHPDRITTPLRRIGKKGSGKFAPISWDEALDEVAQKFLKIESDYGAESIWPYYYAGTMGLLMRDGINRLRHVKKYSGYHSTICVSLAWSGYLAGSGRMSGVDPREMQKSDVIVIWGTNAAVTQVNVMNHALKARRDHGAKIVVVDTYRNATAKQADLFIAVKPGTDGALACSIMHHLFKSNMADKAYLKKYTKDSDILEQHLTKHTPHWASQICGISEDEIIRLANLIGENKKTFLRLGYGFTRQRNGANSMHAVASIAAITGSWLYEGGGALLSNSGIYHWNKTLIEGLDAIDPDVRLLDQSRIGEILTGVPATLSGGPPVKALFIQNTNPMSVAPNLNLVRSGFEREDLFTCVHEQFMTETAEMADIILPATMFMEHDDFYQSGGHQHIHFGPKLITPPGECRSNHEVICDLAKRLNASHEGFNLSAREIIDQTLVKSGWNNLETLEKDKWFDVQPDFETSHFINGFGHADKLWHFRADWIEQQKLWGVEARQLQDTDLIKEMPALPDHWEVTEESNLSFPFRLVTAPARHFLNSSFTETATSQKREKYPTLMINPLDAKSLGVEQDDWIVVSNKRGSLELRAKIFDGVNAGVVIAESIWPNSAFKSGLGINVLTGSDPSGPVGGAAFHDNRVQISPVKTS